MKKKSHFNILILFALITLFGSTTFAAETGMVTMLSLTGARQAAMGEQAILTESDPFNLEYNPAAIAGMEKGKAGLSYHSYFQNQNINTLALIFPAANLDFGVHLRLSSLGDIEARDNIPTTEPLYLFDATDFAGKVFVSKVFSNRFQAGISMGLLLEKIDTKRATAAVFGLGMLYKLDHGFILHGSASNIGGEYKFISENLSTPKILRVGAGYQRDKLNLSADYVNVKSGDGHIHFGGEYLVKEMLYLRTGYQTGYDTRDISAGAGFVHNNLRIDYAFIPYNEDLGTTHRFSLTIAIR